MEILKNIANEIKQNPNDVNLWLKYGQVAAENSQWKISMTGYLAALRQQQETASYEKFLVVYEKYSESKNLDDFNFDIFKLPKKTILICLFGIMNMDVKDLESKVKTILLQAPHYIVLDFSYVSNLTGLGPSTTKKIISWSQEKGVKVFAASVNDSNKHIFKLKKIEVEEYSDILTTFQNLD